MIPVLGLPGLIMQVGQALMSNLTSPAHLLATLQTVGMGAVKAAGSPVATAVGAAKMVEDAGRDSLTKTLTGAKTMTQRTLDTAADAADKAIMFTGLSHTTTFGRTRSARSARTDSGIRDGRMLWKILKSKFDQVRSSLLRRFALGPQGWGFC